MASRFYNVEMMDLIYKIDNQFILPNHKTILAYLAGYADKEGKNIYPKLKSITQDTGFHKVTLINIKRSLIKNNYLLISKERSLGSQQACQYELNIPLIKKQQVAPDYQSRPKAGNATLPLDTNLVTEDYQTGKSAIPDWLRTTTRLVTEDYQPYEERINNEMKNDDEYENTLTSSLTPSSSPFLKKDDWQTEWTDLLVGEGLTRSQIVRLFSRTDITPAYLSANFAHYRANITAGKISPVSPAFLVRCMAENWANFGQPASTPSQAFSAAAVQREPVRQADGSFKTLVTNGDESTREERKAKNEARWQFYLASSEEDRTYWASRVAEFDPWIWQVFEINGFTPDDFITYSANIPDNQLPTFRSLVLRNIDTLASHQLLGWS